MGQRWSLEILKLLRPPSPTPATSTRIEVSAADALAICENGDLLLLREQVANAAGVVMAPTVARDISQMQCGVFPMQRLTMLPGASCVSELSWFYQCRRR